MSCEALQHLGGELGGSPEGVMSPKASEKLLKESDHLSQVK